jgi:dipeptidyl aminopeptidase/acylaminoacyl peptidase
MAMLKLQRIFLAVVMLLAACSLTISLAQSAQPVGYTIDRYLNIRSATSPALAPRGHSVVFLMNTTGTAQVWAVAPTGGWPEQLTFYQDRVDFVHWSPDGSGLLFGKAVGGNENAQLYWMSPDGAQVKALTDAPKVRYNFGAWAHDGRRIAYAANKRNPNFFDIYVMDVQTGREELVYQQDGSNDFAAWSPDDKQIVVARSSDTLSLDNDLYLIDVATKGVTHLTPHEGATQYGDVHFTRDGRALLLSTNAGGEWLALARLDLQTKKIDTLDPTPWDIDTITLSDDGALIAYALDRDGFSELYVRAVKPNGALGPKTAPLKLPAQGVVSGLEFAHDARKLAFSFNGARYNADVWLYDLKARTLAQLTHSSRAGIPQASFIEPELIHYKTFDGRDIPAWFYRPKFYIHESDKESSPITGSASACGVIDSSFGRGGGTSKVHEKCPVLVSVHGGPEGQERPSFNAVYQYFLARGYAILATNVRGSTGYGKTYTHLDDVKLREDSVKDLAAGVEWLKTKGGADPRRIAIMGGSYGGYMTYAAITLYPDLWAAAIAQRAIGNFETNLRNTSGYRRKQREREYGTLEHDLDFLRAISPIHKIDRIRVPLMVVHGRNDPRVPYTEAEQIVRALHERNAPVDYILFDDEGHGVDKLANRLVLYPKIADFLDRYMKP